MGLGRLLFLLAHDGKDSEWQSRGSQWMDKAARSPRETFRTKCSHLQLLCLLGGFLLCARVSFATGSGPSSCGSPSLVVYRPQIVEVNTQDGAFVVPTGEAVLLLLYGENFTNETTLWLTDRVSCSGAGLDLHSLGSLHMLSEDGTRANITIPPLIPAGQYHFCMSAVESTESALLQGSGEDPILKLVITDISSSGKSELFPLPAKIVLILVLILLSGTFSGLNLGLMSLDPTTLKLVMESGSGRQKIYAKLIYRVRRYGNYLLCTLLLGNVLVNNTLAILLDSVLGSGVYAIISSTVAIVIFGEIIPQAICSRHALTIGAYTIWLTYIFMALTFPLSFPISIILHFILGKEIGAVYTREELLGLLKVTEDHHDIGKDEVQMISGALKFKEKTAEDVMTKFEYVYCLDIQSVLDFKTMREIYDSGFSRIPVYEETKSNIVGVLYAKDLTFVDPDDEMPLKQVLDFYNRELTSVYNDTRLDELLEQFAGGQCHLALVNMVVQEGSGDPQLHVVGVVTLEDIVEEILQLEIVDETDRIMDNRSLKPRQRNQVDVGGFMGDSPRDRPHMSSQQRLAVYQFLSSSIEAFKSDKILPGILRRLLLQDVVRQYTQEEVKVRNTTLYRINVPTTSFTLVLEGHVEVEVGKEGMRFEAGPFHYFGVQALELAECGSGDYVPDFTVRPISNCLLLVISVTQYLDARKATKFQKTKDGESSPSLFSNRSTPLSAKVEGSVSAPGKLVNGRAGRSDTSVRSVAKRLRMGGRVKEREESARLLQEEEEEREGEGEQLLPHPLMSPSSGGSPVPVAVVAVELHGGGGAAGSSTQPSPEENPHNIADYTPL